MGPIPLDPSIMPRLELNRRDPAAVLILDNEWTCPECLDHYALDVEGQDRVCVGCAFKRSGVTSVMFFGWTIQKTPNQIIASPPAHRVDG